MTVKSKQLTKRVAATTQPHSPQIIQKINSNFECAVSAINWYTQLASAMVKIALRKLCGHEKERSLRSLYVIIL